MAKTQGKKEPMSEPKGISTDALFLRITRNQTAIQTDVQLLFDGLKFLENQSAELNAELNAIKGKAMPKQAGTIEKKPTVVIKSKSKKAKK